jgi:hypothetical protein
MRLSLLEVFVAIGCFVIALAQFMKISAKKRPVIIGVLVILGIVFVILAAFSPPDGKPSGGYVQTATSSGNGSPATVQSATAPGSNAVVIQAVPGATVNFGLSDESIKLIRQGMVSVEKKHQSELMNWFPGGYLIFTAIKGEQIVPLDRKSDQNIFNTDWTEFSITSTPETITINLPLIIFDTPNMKNMQIGPNEVAIEKNELKVGLKCNLALGAQLLVLSTNDDSLTFAFGIHPEK